MHRHGYQGRKFGRERDQRRALLKGLAANLIEHGSIVTTLPKAKELVPYMEKLVTKAKKNDLHNRRQIIAALPTSASAHKLIDEIVPKLGSRASGHLTIAREGNRRGDNAEMARVSFIEESEPKPNTLKETSGKSETKAHPRTAKKATTPKKTTAKAGVKA